MTNKTTAASTAREGVQCLNSKVRIQPSKDTNYVSLTTDKEVEVSSELVIQTFVIRGKFKSHGNKNEKTKREDTKTVPTADFYFYYM